MGFREAGGSYAKSSVKYTDLKADYFLRNL